MRDDLATVIALELDRVAISGTGNGAEPVGILHTKGVSAIAINVNDPNDQDALDWGKIVDLESLIAAKNADSTAQFIWENGNESGFGMLNGYRVGTTNQMPANTIIFGNFADLIIGQWGVMDVLVDPYTLGTSGGIRIRIMQDVDLAIRHAESFAVAKV